VKRMTQEFREIIYEKREGIAILTLNRPDRMNALTNRMMEEWATALRDAQRDEEVRVVIVTGAGRGFCTGADVKDIAAGVGTVDLTERPPAERRYFLRYTVQQVALAAADLDKPYIAAINGPATGAGMDMASMADIRIASEEARFSMAYVRVGLIPGDGGCYYLPRIVGMAKALELIWTGDIIDAQEALRIGYVSRVVPPDRLMEETLQFARRLAQGPQVAIQQAKRLAYRSQNVDLVTALEMAEYAQLICLSTEDMREGVRAFMERRPPRFKGR